IRVRERRIDATEAVEKAMKRGIGTILTKAEERTIKKANKLGYFDDDRRVTLRQVAEELGLSTTTVSRQIQSGIRKIVRLMLSDDEIDY
ncbi:MAG: helix-turn-helix domain-containing protein, partial [Caldivirga sp.]